MPSLNFYVIQSNKKFHHLKYYYLTELGAKKRSNKTLTSGEIFLSQWI